MAGAGLRGQIREYDPKAVDLIRKAAKTTADPEIAERLGWTVHRVFACRKKHKIPAFQVDFWTDDKVALLKARYIEEGLPASEVGRLLGCDKRSVARKASRLGLRRPTAHRPPKRGSTSPPPPAQPRRDISRAPVNFKAEAKPLEPLDVRIARALEGRAMTTPTLATVVGEKELNVGIQVAAMVHAGVLRQVGGEGRLRAWAVAA